MKKLNKITEELGIEKFKGKCVKCGVIFNQEFNIVGISEFKTCPECRAYLMNKSQKYKYSIRLRHCKKCGRLFQINPKICFGQVKFETWQTCDKCRNKMTNEILTEALAKARGLKI